MMTTMTMKTRRMTMKTTTRLLALVALSCLAACDSRTAGEFRAERASKLYQEAMNDYTAGRLDAAAKGFLKLLKSDPSNTSARFQLACLQQDRSHDYLGALCNYREYILLAPDSDKAKLAKERLAICEKLLVDEYAKKMNPDAAAANAEAVKTAVAELEKVKGEMDKTTEALKSAQTELARAKAENARLRKLVDSIGGEDEGVRQKELSASVKDLLDEEDSEERLTASALDEAKVLNALAEAEDSAFGTESSMLPQQAADAKNKKKSAEDAKRKMKAAEQAKKDAIPDTYVVQEGDTLYKISLRFYGRTSAWKSIREANKATISTDGRVQAGMTIRLPK